MEAGKERGLDHSVAAEDQRSDSGCILKGDPVPFADGLNTVCGESGVKDDSKLLV